MYRILIVLFEELDIDNAYFDLCNIIARNNLPCGSIIQSRNTILPSIIISRIPSSDIWEFEAIVKRELLGYGIFMIEIEGEWNGNNKSKIYR